jgi:hypothetical protein
MEEKIDRMKEGDMLLSDHYTEIRSAAALAVSTLKGFRRDLTLSLQSCKQYMQAEFGELPTGLAVPPFENGMSFSDLRRCLSLAEAAIEGSISIENPPLGPNQEDKHRLLEEINITHKNLADISDSAHRLYERLQAASFEFDVFNSNNILADYPAANILFDRDALNVAMSTARAISERAVRIDIDLMGSKDKLVSSE